ncbi:unnamed protein product [Acanthoscelides obtectus]|uniref:DNA mismatch repair proteins mutS family domain-containing protein n=1 Tax=Acanthoscelides obtectus TaxID=200917 RepID=A0A9P0PCW2_ACAOB|nr:unnamed protein product [Acanthoscelides obtectus]CAK1647341.1 DNA mismatch repair protein Msh2 [Acanthoscelides obtectus]
MTTNFKALNLEPHQQQEFVRFFFNMPEKAPSTVRFFNRGEFYTLHGDDATLASSCRTLQIKCMGTKPQLSYVCLNKAAFESLLRELLLFRQYRVEVYTRSNQGKSTNDWKCEYKGSPGNLTQFEEVLFETSTIDFSNWVMAVKVVQNRDIAVACVNIPEGKFSVCEIQDNESFSELEGMIAQVTPKEAIMPLGDSVELNTIKSLFDRNGILLAKLKKSDFSSNDVLQDLKRLLFFHEDQQRNAAVFPETNLKEAMGCVNALINFLELIKDDQHFNQFKMSTIETHRFVRLDLAALQALNVLPKPGTKITSGGAAVSKSSSLKGLLDNCITTQGRRLLEQWIKQPLRDYNIINERLDVVVSLVKDSTTRSVIVKDVLPRMSDLMPLARKLLSKRANLQDCYRVYQTVRNLPKLIKTLTDMEHECIKSSIADPLKDIAMDMQNYLAMIEQTLDLDLVDRGEFLVKPSYDEDLSELHEEKEKLLLKMQKIQRKVADDLELEVGKTIKLDYTEQHGYFLRVTLKEEPALRKRKNYTIIATIKGGVRFTNDQLSSLNDEYRKINNRYIEQQKYITQEIFEIASGYANSLKTINMYVAKLDVLTSFAVAAVNARVPYVRPKIHKEGSGILNLKKLRHPCIEDNSHISYIPNDVEFDKNCKIMYIITGPNMCGKSTYIRSVGTCVLMAQIGSLVPCEEANISLVDGIHVRVGADDCQLKGISTFMLEMIETSSIIRTATDKSLVIIDELGRGTSTYDGCGIAWAIAEHLAQNLKSFSLFATHFHELSRLAEENTNVENLHVTAVVTENTITPLYQVRKGECDKSYGIYCARMVGFPDDVIQESVNYQTKLEDLEGMKHINNFEQPIKRKLVKEADAVIKNVMNKLKTLNSENNDDDENILKTIKSELDSQENLFLKGLVS